MRFEDAALRDDAGNKLRRCDIKRRIVHGHSGWGDRVAAMDRRHFERIALFNRDIGARLCF